MLTFTTLVFLLSSSAVADEGAADRQAPPPDAAATADKGADDILVTATRLALPLDKVAASLTVLDKAAIDRMQDIGVSELLLRTPGVSMARNGGYGTATSLRIRGAESDQTVVVIDGVKLNDPSAAGGGYNFANLLVGDAERIEILRGPQSILWGSQAIGGVVNVVTALPTQALEGSFDVEAGSRDTVSARAAIGGNTGPLRWRIGGQTFTTAGISAIAPAFGGRERDGYRNRQLTGRAEVALASNLTVDLRGYYSSGRTEFDATTADSPAYGLNREFVGYAGLRLDLLDGRFRNRIGYGYTDTDRDNFDPRLARKQTFDSAGRNQRLEYQGSFAIADGWTAQFGVENERSRFRSVSPPSSLSAPIPNPARGRAEITSVYGQLSVEPLAGLTLTGGARHDDHNRFGGQTLASAGAIWALPTGTVLRASYGEGFKAPTLYQLFSEYGNQALSPESAHGWEAGAEQRFLDGRLRFGGVWFDRTTKDQIIFNSCSASSTLALCYQPGSTTIRRSGYYQNVARAQAHGIEAQASVEPVPGLLIDGNYSWTVSEDRSPGGTNFGRWLPRRPRNQANGSISYAWPFGLTTGAAVRWLGHSYDNASNALRLDDYTLVDLRAEVKLFDQLRLFARVENLFDEGYMTAYRYGTLGRSIYAGLRGRF
ncbi:TonB-dependent receptor [Sphingobium sp. CR2-8]|uniref:TonB-dependent receptor plug domain-containing protein n=1 Tax=Sphingobium sp. CR2-8 TaxID=1306534 RepID=UPI002DBCC4CC|nr:TonB-dependent receptor [Sphingobium sp. CR2-8]MEC3909811.1 TonB-dependent receptor [Sphingobium sp. CR2-8]